MPQVRPVKKRPRSVLEVAADRFPQTLPYDDSDDDLPSPRSLPLRSNPAPYQKFENPKNSPKSQNSEKKEATLQNLKKIEKSENHQKIEKIEKIEKMENEKTTPNIDDITHSLASWKMNSIHHIGAIPRFMILFQLTNLSTTLPILLDSGAGESFISRETLKNLKLDEQTETCYPYQVKGAFGQVQLVTEKIVLPLHTDNWKDAVSFYVVDDLSESAICGLPFMKRNAQYINLEQLTFDNVPCMTRAVEDPIKIDCISRVQFRRDLQSRLAVVGILKLDWHEESTPSETSKTINPDASQIMKEYSDVVTNEKPPFIPDIGEVTHEIHLLPDATTPARPPYRMSASENIALNQEIEELLKQGAIVPSSSPFSAPVLFVKKKDGSLRLCVDYRMLNDRTIRNKFPLPVIDDIIDSLGGAKYFSKLDLMAGYHQIRIQPGDEFKTAFSTRTGHYQFLVMPFGLTNAPATFQSFMNHILAPYLHQFVVVYLDDILIYSQTKEEHQTHIRQVLDILRAHKLIAKKSKCEFFTNETSFLGFKLSPNGILPLDDKMKVVKDFPTPTTAKSAQSFMGLASFYRRFIPNFSKIASPIIQYMHGKSSWSRPQEMAFATLKQHLTSPPILTIPDITKNFVLTTDASHECIGATLEQFNPDGTLDGVIGYFSKRLQGSQLNYSVQEQEFLAVIEALRQYRHLLIGKHFKLRTDHFSLTYLMIQTKTPQGRIARWLDILAEYDFSIEHIPGTKNTAADALSRINVSTISTATTHDEGVIQQIRESIPSDNYFGEIYTTLKEGDDNAVIPKHIRHYIKHYRLIDGLLYFTTTVGSDNNAWRLCIPKIPTIRNKLCNDAHEPPTSGHFGPYKTYFLLAQTYYWPHMFKDIRRFIQSCDNCQRCKTGSAGTDGLLQPLDIPEQRWSSISLDFVTGLPLSNGFNAILVVIDRLTKRGHFIPTVKAIDAAGTAQLYMKEIVRLHGVPQSIVSDRDIRFVNTFWEKLHELMGSRLLFSTANHPQTDGQTERLNRILNTLLRTYCFNEHNTWTNYLDMVEFAYNNSYQKSIDTTPFIADLGYQPATLGFHNTLLTPGYNIAVEDLGIKLKAILTRIQDQMAHAQRSQEQQANKNRNFINYQIGDLVLIHRNAYAKSDTYRKIQPAFLGPFKVVDKIGDNVCEIDLPEHRKTHRRINVEYLRPYTLRESYPKIPPQSEQEALQRVHEIIGIAGWDQERKTWDLQWQDCHPEHVSTVSDDFLQQYVPDSIHAAIWQNLAQLNKIRDESFSTPGNVRNTS